MSEGRSSARVSAGGAAEARERSGDARRGEAKESAEGFGLPVERWRKRSGSVEVEVETAMATGRGEGMRVEGRAAREEALEGLCFAIVLYYPVRSTFLRLGP